jgi:predicted CopG family antitoxin
VIDITIRTVSMTYIIAAALDFQMSKLDGLSRPSSIEVDSSDPSPMSREDTDKGCPSNHCNMTQATKRIPVREETFEVLGTFKGAGETWDDVVTGLIELRQRENRRQLIERTGDDEYVPLEDG